MKKTIILFFAILMAFQSNSQSGLIHTKVLQIENKKVTGISDDSLLSTKSSDKLVTEGAVKKFADNHLLHRVGNESVFGNKTFGDNSTFFKLDSIIFFGNSITYGVGASSTLMRWTRQLSDAFGWIEVNKGYSGTKMQKLANGDMSMEDRISEIPIYTTGKKYVVFSYGVNDSRNYGYDTAGFRYSYYNVINACIAKGWPTNRIIVCTPSYYDDNINEAFVGNLILWQNVASSVATIKGVRLIDIYSNSLANKESYLGDGDRLHPINSGHTLHANWVYNSLVGWGNIANNNSYKNTFNTKVEFNTVVTMPNCPNGGVDDSLLTISNNIIRKSKSINSLMAGTFFTERDGAKPSSMDMSAGWFSSTENTPANAKIAFLNGGTSNAYGFGLSADGGMEYWSSGSNNRHTFHGEVHMKNPMILDNLYNGNSTDSLLVTHYISGVRKATLSQLTGGTSFGSASGDVPNYVDLGGTYSSTANTPANAKLVLFAKGAGCYGFGVSSGGGLEIFASSNKITSYNDHYFAANIIKTGGTSSQALMADGSTKTIVSGTYTPTITNEVNVTTLSIATFIYSRVGSVVTVSGAIGIEPTANATTTSFKITLPVPSSLSGGILDLGGTGFGADFGTSIQISGGTDGKALFKFKSNQNSANDICSFSFSYLIN